MSISAILRTVSSDCDTAFELHRFRAAFLDQAAGIAKRFLGLT